MITNVNNINVIPIRTRTTSILRSIIVPVRSITSMAFIYVPFKYKSRIMDAAVNVLIPITPHEKQIHPTINKHITMALQFNFNQSNVVAAIFLDFLSGTTSKISTNHVSGEIFCRYPKRKVFQTQRIVNTSFVSVRN